MQDIINAFSKLEDFRVRRTKKHILVDIICIALCATISGAEGYNEIADWGNAKEKWLRKFLSLPHGIPSHDTFNRVFSLLDPTAFHQAFLSWVESINALLDGRLVAIDGKTLRRSYDKRNNKKALHLVSAWASELQLSFGQVQVDEKSNEITAIPELLRMLALEGAIVSMDAMGTQKEIAKQIIDKKADYVLALKKNHGDLYDDVETYFKLEKEESFRVINEPADKNHGRIEKRSYSAASALWLRQAKDWSHLQTIVKVDSISATILGEAKTTLYYLTSLPAKNINLIARAIRGHWGIENSLHWCLDVIFKEDSSRIRNRRSATNIALIRKLSLSLLKQESTKKISLKRKRFLSGIDNDYLLKVLNARPA